MECPFCKGTDQQIEAPFEDDDKVVKRRINCENCGEWYYLIFQQSGMQDKILNPIVEDFLPIVYLAVSNAQNDAATDIVFDNIDRMLCDGSFSQINALLKRVEVEKLNSTLMRSFMTITAAARDKLPARKPLYDKIYARMIELKGQEKADKILKNLE